MNSILVNISPFPEIVEIDNFWKLNKIGVKRPVITYLSAIVRLRDLEHN